MACHVPDHTHLKINENEFLFDVVKDPLERANLSRKQADVFARMKREFDEWNAQMLNEDEVRNAYGFYPQQLADHYSPTRPTVKRQVNRQPFQQ